MAGLGRGLTDSPQQEVDHEAVAVLADQGVDALQVDVHIVMHDPVVDTD